MVGGQTLLRPWLRRVCRGPGLADSGIGFQGAFRMPEPASTTAQQILSGTTFPLKHPLVYSLAVHITFGASAGIAMSVVPRGYIYALGYGTVLWFCATEIALPALRLTRWPKDSSRMVQIFGLIEHMIFVITVEGVTDAMHVRG